MGVDVEPLKARYPGEMGTCSDCGKPKLITDLVRVLKDAVTVSDTSAFVMCKPCATKPQQAAENRQV